MIKHHYTIMYKSIILFQKQYVTHIDSLDVRAVGVYSPILFKRPRRSATVAYV